MFYDETTDPGLLQSIRDWSEDDGWRCFHGLYAPRIRTHALACGLSSADAEEVVQETMLKVARHLPGFEYDRTVCRFRTWLNQIVNQRVCDVHRRLKRGRVRGEILAGLARSLELSESAGAPGFLRGECETEMRRLEVCLARLRVDTRADHWQIFEAYALQGLTASQVATLFHTNASRVWVVHHRMVRSLRRIWRQLLEHPF